MSTPLSGGYCGGVPPLPIPNREVKPTCADGTAMQCGRVGSRLLFYQSVHLSNQMDAFFIYVPYGPPANPSAKGLAFPRMEKVVSRMVWRSRAWRDSFPERFDVSALGESYFPNGLMFPRMARVISRMVCYFRAWRESFPEWFVISAHGESCFPNGLKLSPYAETFVRSWSVCCCLSLITYNISCFIMASIYLVEDFLLHG